MDPLAGHLNDNGFLTVNTRYELADFDHPGYPTAVEDVACAVRYAAGHPDGDGTVAVIGHSAGAHIGALVALTGDDYVGPCPYEGTGIPDRFVGLAGPYDVSRLGLAIAAFFGGGPERIPDAWAAGNPQLLTDENPDLLSLIMYGELDGIVPETFALAFDDALTTSGSDSTLELIEGARHNEMHDPALVGDLIVAWLQR
jgi:acetyl esterase/lipase